MKVLEISDSNEALGSRPAFLDLETIRRRVVKIQNGWTEDTARARAIEGARRRRILEDIYLDLLCDTDGSEESCDLEQHGFSLVG